MSCMVTFIACVYKTSVFIFMLYELTIFLVLPYCKC
nr:MAG TPA: hypothetical protein [Caudoviricetes sp.]